MDLTRVRGCLIGGAVGDALGLPLKEIAVIRRLRFKYGATPPKNLSYAGRPPARFSDETQLMMWISEGMIRHLAHGTDRADRIRDALLSWKRTQRGPGAMNLDGLLSQERRMYQKHMTEGPPLLALDAVALGERPGLHEPLNDCSGPTAMVRSAPYGIGMPTSEAAFETAYRDSSWTHGSPLAALGAAAFASLIHGLVRGVPLADAMGATVQSLGVVEGADGPTAIAITQAHELASKGAPEPEAMATLGDGRDAQSALAIALASVMTLEDTGYYGIVRTMWRAVAHEGSSDTTGSLAGQLLGAMVGVDAFPPAWLIELEMIEVLERLAADLHTVVSGNPVNGRAYPG